MPLRHVPAHRAGRGACRQAERENKHRATVTDEPSRPPYRVSLIVFDVDGTLVDFASATRAALAAAAEHLSLLTCASITPAAIIEARDRVLADPAARGLSRDAVRVEAARRLLLERDVTEGDAAADVDRTYVTTREASITVYSDVRQTLEELRERGFELRAASNGAMDLTPLGLAEQFAATEYAPHLGVSKPDPAFYATVVERAGVPAAHVLAVGDRVDNDYLPARAAGLHALLIDRAGNLNGTLPRVRALTEVAALVERITP